MNSPKKRNIQMKKKILFKAFNILITSVLVKYIIRKFYYLTIKQEKLLKTCF